MKDPIDEIREALEYPDFLERIDELRGYDVAERRLLDRLEAAEKERDNYKSAYSEWREKTEWVQEGINSGAISPKYLGWHRADVAADLLKVAEQERDTLRASLDEERKEHGYTWQASEAEAKDVDRLRAKIERMDEAMESLLIRCDDSDSVMYGTLSTSFVRDTVRIARDTLEESK